MTTSSPKRKPRAVSTATVQWSQRAKEVGLHIPGMSIGHVQKLLEIQAEPLPVAKRAKGQHNQPSPSPKVSIGPAITNGLLRLNAELGCYVVTWKGDFYLKQLKEAGLV